MNAFVNFLYAWSAIGILVAVIEQPIVGVMLAGFFGTAFAIGKWQSRNEKKPED